MSILYHVFVYNTKKNQHTLFNILTSKELRMHVFNLRLTRSSSSRSLATDPNSLNVSLLTDPT